MNAAGIAGDTPQGLLTTRQVAEMLGLSPEAVLRRWRAGELPGFRLSSKVLRFRQSEILAYLEERREGPRPPHLRAVRSLPPATDEGG